jgi:menaquinone reductase, multiheme cytochrome c subunit
MAAIFPKSSDLILKIVGAVVGLGAVAGVAGYAYYTYPTNIDTGFQPVQPVPYSHKLHAGQLGLDCFYCHSTVYKAAYAAIPATETCMNCHTRVKPQSPRLEPVRQSYATGMPIPWIKIHKLPDFVYFNHMAHITAGVSCVSCHGRIDQMIEVHQDKPLNMAFCLACHKDPAPNVRPVELVTKLDWVPDPALGKDAREIGAELIAQKHLNPPTNCSGCHR